MKQLKWSLITFLLISCGTPDAPSSEIVSAIEQAEQELKILSIKRTSDLVIREKQSKLLQLLQKAYQSSPEGKSAPEYLDKIHMLYVVKGDFESAAKYADTLIVSYPEYLNRPMVLESQANNYDMFVKPRDPEKVRYYLELLLKENPDLPNDKKQEIRFRLKHVDKTIEQIIEEDLYETEKR